MKKSEITQFINKYYLGGEIKSAKWVSTEDTLSTRVISGDKSVVGSVVWDNIGEVELSEFGVYNTTQFLSLLSVIGDEFEFKLSKIGNKFVSVNLIDTTHDTVSQFMLSDLSVIPAPPPFKNLPKTYELELKIDKYFIDTFISGQGALSDSDSFTIITRDNSVSIVIGYSNVGTNRITIPIKFDTFNEIPPLSFNSGMFANILQANKECESVSMKVSTAGLVKLNFEIDNFKSEYYLVSTQNVV